LRESRAYAHGTACEIYGADRNGTIELRAANDDRIAAREAVCFLRVSGAAARRDYQIICAAAAREPAPCAIEIELARLRVFSPSDVTALHYSAGASTIVASWLGRFAAGCGDRVQAGIDVYQRFASARGIRFMSDRLPCAIQCADRTWDEVMASVAEPVQR
jgi:hypothetical protein